MCYFLSLHGRRRLVFWVSFYRERTRPQSFFPRPKRKTGACYAGCLFNSVLISCYSLNNSICHFLSGIFVYSCYFFRHWLFLLLRTKSSLLHSRFSVVTQSSLWGGALRDDTKNGCVADYTKSCAFFFSSAETAQLPSLLLSLFLSISVQLPSIVSVNIFQILSTLAGYEELPGGFKPTKSAEIF